MADNIITAVFGATRETKVRPRYRYDVGQVLMVRGVKNLPDFYEVHFANEGSSADATPLIGTAEGVEIPATYFQSGATIYAYIYVHDEATDGTTVYKVTIPIINRARPANIDPDPEEADIIAQAIVALNENVGKAEDAAAEAEASAAQAQAAAVDADESTQSASASSAAASSARTAAQSAAQAAALSESNASDYMDVALDAANKANTQASRASGFSSAAESYAWQAKQSEDAAKSAKDAAVTAKNDAQTAATSAASSRDAAQTAATEAGTAKVAAETAQSAAEAAQTVAQAAETNTHTYAGQAFQSATDAAQSAASAAQTLAQVQAEGQTQIAAIAAEGQRVLDSIPEDYTELRDEVWDAYPTDTVSGNVANFADGASDIPVKDLVIGIEPVQSGSGDPSPDNVRPINGWAGAQISVNGNAIVIDWTDEAGTVYGGTLNVLTGVLTVDRIMLVLGDYSLWAWHETTSSYSLSVARSGIPALAYERISCEALPYVARPNLPAASIGISISETGATIFAKDGTHTGAEGLSAFVESIQDVKAVFYLAEPQSYQLDPVDVRTTLGNNTIYADTGDTSITYRADPVLYANAKYVKPAAGIPKADLASDVQTSLDKADTALQSAPVATVAGKTGEVTLDAGDVSYDDQQTYDDGTVGAGLADLKSQTSEIQSAIDYDVVTPLNLLNLDAVTDGILKANGTTEESTTRYYTDYIPVKPGDVVRQYFNTNTTYRYNLCAYDSNKTVVTSAGSDSSASGGYTVPNGISYVRLTLSTTYKSNTMVTINTVPTAYSSYFAPYIVYNRDLLTAETKKTVDGIPADLADMTVKGTNIVPTGKNGVGAYYASGSRIVFDATSTTMHYVIAAVKPNTDYFVNFSARFWILTDDNDNIITSGASFVGYVINTGNATKLYYTVYNNNWGVGLIIAEGYHGTNSNLTKPAFVKGLNQLTSDSWYAVALTPSVLRFTQGIPEKLYWFNILALAKNKIALTLGGTPEEDGYAVNTTNTTYDSNTYGYVVYDDNLSVVETMLRGGRNRLTICADNVSNCSAIIIGDSIVARDNATIGQTMLDAFAERGKTLTLFGTLGSGANKNEGRPGWTSRDYFTDKQYEGVTNPFYNPTSQTFDFGYYMTNAGYSAIDFVIIHLGGNDLFSVAFDEARERIELTKNRICAMIDSVLDWNPNQKIIIQLAPTISPNRAFMNAVSGDADLIRAKFVNYNAEMLVLLPKYTNNVRCSNDYMIVDPNNDMADHIHPNTTGLTKIGMELVSQINCWQHDAT